MLFEWEAFSNIREFSVGNGYDMSTRGIVLTMLTAHWFYWGAVSTPCSDEHVHAVSGYGYIRLRTVTS